MNIPINVFMWVMAFLPIAVLLVLMIKFQWGATEAAPIGLLITIITGIFFYKADLTLIAAESAKGIWNALIILLIVWTAILMYQVGDEAKAFLVSAMACASCCQMSCCWCWLWAGFLKASCRASPALVCR